MFGGILPNYAGFMIGCRQSGNSRLGPELARLIENWAEVTVILQLLVRNRVNSLEENKPQR
jgi:hypothetical protein